MRNSSNDIVTASPPVASLASSGGGQVTAKRLVIRNLRGELLNYLIKEYQMVNLLIF